MFKSAEYSKEIKDMINKGMSNVEIYEKYEELKKKYKLTMKQWSFQGSVRNLRSRMNRRKKKKETKGIVDKQLFNETFDKAYCDLKEKYKEKAEYKETKSKEGNKEIHININNCRYKTLDYVIDKYNIDLNHYEVIEFVIRDATVHTNYRDQNLTWEDGRMTGYSIREPRFITLDICHISVKFKEKKPVIIVEQIIKDQIEDMQKYAPDYSQAPYIMIRPDAEFVFEIPPFDVHFGLLCWHEQVGHNYDVKIAKKMLLDGIKSHLGNTKGYNICEIVMPLGSDFFNVDNQFLTTARSSHIQDEDCREAKTFRMARETLVEAIDLCSQVASVRVLIVPGNHELNRLFHLGDALYCWYRNNKNVTIDNKPTTRKYYQWGNNLRMYTHGSEEKRERLRSLIVEENSNYSQTKYREILSGHLHRELVIDIMGVIFRTLPSFVVSSEYIKRKGFIHLRNFQTFLIHKKRGLRAQFNWPE